MNRKNLTAAVLAGLAGVAGIAGTAQAVNLNPDGTGQVLLYPYYTTNDGNQTLLSVVNTTDQAKAVKVRFLEGYNSREVLDFNLYLSPEDVWVAALADSSAFGAAAGVPHLYTNDSSCTVPYLYEAASTAPGLQAFLNFAYTGDFDDAGPDSIARAAEGHVEMIEMATLVNDGDYMFADWVTHGPALDDGPADCAKLTEAWTEVVNDIEASGIWVQESLDDIGGEGQVQTGSARNSGGLFGGAAIVNADNGTMYSYDAKAIQGFDNSEYGVHYRPGTIYPSLASGAGTTAYVFFGVPQNQAVMTTYSTSVDAISSVFMHDFLMNEYVVDPDLNAGTEWVITFPTKNFYVDAQTMSAEGLDWPTTGDCSDDPAEDAEPCVNYARPPFTELFGAMEGDERVCEVVNIKTWDREENTFNPEDPDVPVIPPVVSPSAPPTFDCEDFGNCPSYFQLCYEVNVLRFGDEVVFGTPEIEGESLLVTVSDEFTTGWGRIDLTENERTSTLRIDSQGLVGLPVTGFAAYEFENGFLEGGSVKANYGGLFGHKFSVKAVAAPDPQ